MARIVITGGSGYIGVHTAKLLLQAGHEVFNFDPVLDGVPAFLREHPRYHSVWGNILRPDSAWDKSISGMKPHVIVHLAALIDAAASVKRPDLYYYTNVQGMAQMLSDQRAALLNGSNLCGIVFASSAAVYGEPVPGSDSMRMRETSPLDPTNPYGATKVIGERMLQDFGMRSISLRYFNIAGADPDGDVGPPRNNGSLCHSIMKAAQQNTEFRLNPIISSDGSDGRAWPIRDFVHVKDVARANLAAVNRLLDLQGRGNEIFNICSGRGTPIDKVVNEYKKHCPSLKVAEGEPRLGDTYVSVGDPTRAAHILDWKVSSLSDVDKMVSTSLIWPPVPHSAARPTTTPQTQD